MGKTAPPEPTPRRPWHIWAVGVGYAVLAAGGAYDYVKALGEDPDYFRSQHYTPEQIRYFTDYPLLPAIFWTIGVWAAVSATVLLLACHRWALLAAAAALGGQLVLDVITFGFRDRWHALGPRLALFDAVVLLLTTGFLWYCRTLTSRDVLR
ncbi:Uncharacterised protein [Mycobacteroides abscessus subsp. abscessus]|uniref:hypothetical protein n=1 Tax=Mycobacteroides abscessus TaxID=36809 RepID=UPI0009A8DA7B|nr:hypothetical protein [Mycobacteroides abscessus]SKE08622.1 Uncharacterised protein [Mycobacteroides abscessus subsp. abscessus]